MKKFAAVTMTLVMVYIFGGIASADFNDGLIAYYPFNGNANDESGNGNHGTPLPDEVGPIPSEDMCGNPNSAYSFDGVDDHISLPDSLRVQPFHSYSFSFWLKTTQKTRFELFEQRTGNNSPSNLNLMITFNIWEEKEIVFSLPGYGNNQTQVIQKNVDFDDNVFHHLCLIKDVSNAKMHFYMDGILVTSTNITDIDFSVQGTLLLGIDYLYTTPFNGEIDEVRIYNRALSACEVNELYLSSLCVPSKIICVCPPEAEPETIVSIWGEGFGDTPEGSIVHIGGRTFDSSSPRITLWTPKKIDFKIPFGNKKCSWYKKHNDGYYRNKKVWVTVGSTDSNKKKLKILPPPECEVCYDNLWNFRWNGDDRFHDNTPWLRPWRYDYEDGWGIWVGEWAYDLEWSETYTQSSGSVNGLSWEADFCGNLTVTGSRDRQWHAWTYVYVDDPKTLQIPFTPGNGTSVPSFFINYNFDTPYQYINQEPITLYLVAGWNRIDITGYNQNDNFTFDLNYDLAYNVELMSSAECK